MSTFLRARMIGLALVLPLVLPAAAQDQPRRGGTLVVSLPGEPQHMNPAITTHLPTRQAASNLYNALVSISRDRKIRPELAERWDISADGLTYTFHLARNVRWHDGRPFTSADVKFSINEINRKYDGPATTGFAMVKDIETPDPNTVVFRLATPFAAFFPWSFSSVWILPKHIYENTEPTKNAANQKPIGTGPYVFGEWVRGSHVRFDRNPNYFKPGRPYVDRVVFKVIPDASARVAALESGDIDYLNFISMPPTAVGPLSKNTNVHVDIDRNRANFGQILAHLNLRSEVLKSKEVRHALAHAVNQKDIIEKALDGYADVATGPISPQQKEWYNDKVRRFEYSPQKANALLDQAGFPRKGNAPRFALRISYDRTGEGGALQSAAEIMRENLRAVGIDLRLQPLDGATWMDAAHVKWDFDISLGSYQTGPDPSVGVSRLYITKNISRRIGTNLMGYSNPIVDKLFDQAEVEMNPAKRRQILNEAQAVLAEEVPALWLWAKAAPSAQWKHVRGDLPPGTTHLEALEQVWMAEKAKR